MKKYRITEKAGRFVAGRRNPGAGTELALTPRAAAHELRLGTLAEAGPARTRRRTRPQPEEEPETPPAPETAPEPASEGE